VWNSYETSLNKVSSRTMGMLRIWDVVRYTGDFVPQTTYILNSNMKALFNFDGGLRGISSLTKTPVAYKINSMAET